MTRILESTYKNYAQDKLATLRVSHLSSSGQTARVQVFKALFKVGHDLTAAPASEAYCERIFSVCGDLALAKQNRLQKNLEMRVFLKVNKRFIQ
jgi:hypothetical protein